jgi:DNA topoisomerase-1
MAKSLVIVESPAKAKTINKILGSKYIVKASMGHVRDLPKKEFGIEIGDGKKPTFEPIYKPLAEKKKTIDELKKAAKSADAIYLACDFDREGEAIAWHIASLLKAPPEKTHRVVFNEITAPAIQAAFKKPHKISIDRVNAQQARRILDRLVGYKISPLLWKKVLRGLSAGRVQSVAVRLIVEREREIQAFKPEEYWKITAALSPEDRREARFEAELKQWAGAAVTMPDEASARAVEAELRSPATAWVVKSVTAEDKKDNPDPPFRTATLQQQASIRLRYSAKKTMALAQQLYEGVELGEEGSVGLITYMRTDSLNIAEEAIEECRAFIRETFDRNLPPGKESYLSEKPRRFRTEAKGAQEAHEAIRPTSARRTPDAIARYLTPDQLKLYRLIWERFVATQMKPAIYTLTTIEVEAGRGLFKASGKVLKFDGHARVTGVKVKEDEPILPAVREGDRLALHELRATQHFTQPPPRYTEATLVKMLEKAGIGRPSTYAQIISTIQTRGYVKKEHRKFFATDVGMIVTDKLVRHFPDIMETEFTSRMETELDEIEEAKRDWQDVLRAFYKVFDADLERAKKEMKHVNEEGEKTDFPCPTCGKPLVVKRNRWGKFLGCSGYPDCTYTVGVEEDEQGKIRPKPKVEAQVTEHVCEKCGKPMVIKRGRRGEFLACSGYPKCKNARDLTPEGKPAAPRKIETEIECDRCKKNKMVVRMGRRGPFLGCGGYPRCRNTRDLTPEEAKNLGVELPPAFAVAADAAAAPQVEAKCEACGRPMTVKRGRRGSFLACTGYPECKKTAPLPAEMRTGPKPSGETCDKCGKPMVVRMSRRGPFQGCSGYPECKNAKPLGGGDAAAPAGRRDARRARAAAVGGDDEDVAAEAGAEGEA